MSKPWRYTEEMKGVYGQEGSVIIIAVPGDSIGRFTSQVHARRACAAVNACEGISTEALESGAVFTALEGVANLEAFLADNLRNVNKLATHPMQNEVAYHALHRVRAILTKVKL